MNLVFLTIFFPLLGFLLLSFFGKFWKEDISSAIGVGSIGLSGLVTIYIIINYFSAIHNDVNVYIQSLWLWMSVNSFCIPISFRIDGLSLVMLIIVVGISFFVHLYASWYMQGDIGYSRFFAYMNLFVANMIILILADNLLLMYLGWEGVGFCSYLLIGFYYIDVKNGLAALKAFIVTRISDILLLCGLFILYDQLGTLNFLNLSLLLSQKIEEPFYIFLAALMLFIGAIGKSAQFPLHIWLSDAMVAPSPVSALIHAATMVTSGVYLIARTHTLFLLFSNILMLVTIVGLITLIISSLYALVQDDIKKILAYSTIGQVGYMFLSLGVEGWYSAIFHLVTHSFFKSLLFLASGSLIIACDGERNIFRMGGLYKSMPLIYMCFLMGGLSLSSFPIITSGFYSKEAILFSIVSSNNYGIFTLFIGLVGSFLTALYTFRMIFLIFHGEKKIKPRIHYNFKHNLSLIVLLVFSTFVGSWIQLPLDGVFPVSIVNFDDYVFLKWISSIIILLGICLAYVLWFMPNSLMYVSDRSMIVKICSNFLYHYDLLDWLYKQFFVKFYFFVTRLISRDPLDNVISNLSVLVRSFSCLLTFNENGQLRWYAFMISMGALFMIILLLFF